MLPLHNTTRRQKVDEDGWSAYSSVCVRRSAAAREFTWCMHTHQCVFVEVQRLLSSYGVYTHSSVCIYRSAAYRDRVHMVYIHTHRCVFIEVQHIEIEFTWCIHTHQCHRQNFFLLLADYEVPIVHKNSI